MPLTILQIIPHLGAGGAEQACLDIVAGLHERGDRALVVSAGGHRVGEVARLGGEHILHPVHSKNPAKIIANAWWLARLVRAQKVDVIHVRSRAPAWSAWLASRWTGRPLVTTFHAAYKFSHRLKKFYNRVMTRADRIIAISHFVAEHIRDAYGVDPALIRVVSRGIDLDRFTPDSVNEERREALRKAWGLQAGKRIILLPARLSPIKGQALIIRAMALLPPELSAVAVIVGDDQGRKDYRRELESLMGGREASVLLVNHCADMPAAYSLADLVVMPSLVPEGFGRVPVEAMAMGVPVLASALGATKETVLEGETGWLLPPDDPAAWARAIQKALALPPEQRAAMAVRSMQRVHAHYNRRVMIAETLKVYEEVVGHA